MTDFVFATAFLTTAPTNNSTPSSRPTWPDQTALGQVPDQRAGLPDGDAGDPHPAADGAAWPAGAGCTGATQRQAQTHQDGDTGAGVPGGAPDRQRTTTDPWTGRQRQVGLGESDTRTASGLGHVRAQIPRSGHRRRTLSRTGPNIADRRKSRCVGGLSGPDGGDAFHQ